MITLPELPFKHNALDPHITERTIDFHYGKHHRGYVHNLNMLIEGTKYEHLYIEDIVKQALTDTSIFNNAGQVWNHTFYWNCLSPNSDETNISEQLREAINNDFGSLDEFKELFKKQGTKLFGSGWTWLVVRNGKLQIQSYRNADTPLKHPNDGILVVDFWEHAYYLQYQNDRGKYLDAIWEIVNWEFVSKKFEKIARPEIE